MAFKVQIGPVQIAIHQGQTVLVTRPDGQVNCVEDDGEPGPQSPCSRLAIV
jgi:hypothetical protein